VGHVVAFEKPGDHEIYLDGIMCHSYRDPIVGAFCPLIDDQGYAGYADVVRDQYLLMRVTEFPADFGVVGCFGSPERHNLDTYDKPAMWMSYHDTSNMGMLLRPGEAITRRTAYLGRSAIEPALQMDAVVNGDLTYHPNFADGSYKYGVTEEKEIKAVGGQLRPTAAEATVAFGMACPHPILNGTVRVGYQRASWADRLELEINIEGRGWERIWRATRVGQASEVVYLWPLDEIRDRADRDWMVPAFNYQLRFRLNPTHPGESLALTDLSISSLFQTFYQTIPRLTVGDNLVQYQDETAGPHHVTITHRWKESSFSAPPPPPAAPVVPADGASMKGYEFTFQWQPGTDPNGEGILNYEWEASKRADFMWPIAPNFSNYTWGKSSDPVPNYSLLTDGVTYYWHVRCQNQRGVWGPWSKTWTFRCRGPRVPVGVKLRQEGRTWVLSWQPPPEGTRPVKYEIFADNMQGFVPIVTQRIMYPENSRAQYEKPSNILLTTDQTEAVVVADGLKEGDGSYFRVAAIDADGSRGGPSDYVVAKHPCLFTNPVTVAKVGQAYQYQARSLLNLGEMTEAGGSFTYAHKDTLSFALKQAPEWLKVDAATGLLTGTPVAPGPAAVTLEVSDGHGGSDTQSFTVEVAP
jgi:hypothetical protein